MANTPMLNAEAIFSDHPINQDTAPGWDGAPSVAQWHDVYTPAELAAAIRLQAAKLAKRYGIYEVAAELTFAADCIEDLAEGIEGAGR